MDQTSFSSGNKIPGLDHLRALAIILVFIFHYRLFTHPEWVDLFNTYGWTGVDLFFVLSGYLIARQVFKASERGDFKLNVFYTKRFFRILPAYWVVLTLYFAIPVFREWGNLAPLWKFLTFTQNFGLDRVNQGAFSHAWSLCVEEQFYLFFPLVVIALYKSKSLKAGPYILVSLLIIGFLLRYLSWATMIDSSVGTPEFKGIWLKWLYYPTYNRLDGLLAGIAIAGIFTYRTTWKEKIIRHANLVLLIGAGLAVCGYFLCIPFESFNASLFGYPLVSLAGACLVGSALAKNSWLNRIGTRITGPIATLSYSLYLVHKATIHLTQDYLNPFGFEKDSTGMFIMCVLVSLAGATALYYLVEVPFHKIRDRVLVKKMESGKTKA